MAERTGLYDYANIDIEVGDRVSSFHGIFYMA